MELDAGLYVDGELFAERRQRIGDRRQLSVGIGMETRPTRSGVLEVVSARLDEVSLCHRGRWMPYVLAAITPAA